MKTSQEIKQAVANALTNCGVFDSVLTPSDDRRESTIMHEPCAAVYYSGCRTSEDNGIRYIEHIFDIRMKFLKIGINETAEDIETAINALKELEPVSIKQSAEAAPNSRSATYRVEIRFAGCKG